MRYATTTDFSRLRDGDEFFGVDSSVTGDWTVEVKMRKKGDNAVEVLETYSYRRTINLEKGEYGWKR